MFTRGILRMISAGTILADQYNNVNNGTAIQRLYRTGINIRSILISHVSFADELCISFSGQIVSNTGDFFKNDIRIDIIQFG